MGAAVVEVYGRGRPSSAPRRMGGHVQVRPARRHGQMGSRNRPTGLAGRPVGAAMPARQPLGLQGTSGRVQSCSIAAPAASVPFSDRVLLVFMIGLGLLFLAGVGVLVQGFWQISGGAGLG